MHLRTSTIAALTVAALVPAGHRPEIHVTITDDFPLAQALVIIEAVPAASPEKQP